MKEYKQTLNLPVTEFPMKASLAQREPAILQQWEQMNLYQQLCEQGKSRLQKFVLLDGPPYANGNIHIGHALDRTLKDIIVKSKRLSGLAAPLVPGWDCHGLPIELNVEKKIGKAGVEVSATQFRQACREYAQSQIEIQRAELKRLGIIADWQNPYLTMNFSFEASVVRALAKMIENGHLAQGFKPVHWCIDCRSALAEAEVEYANKVSPEIDVRFRAADQEAFLRCFVGDAQVGHGPVSVIIWTTTPWTLPANEAVSLNPEFEYALVQVETAQGPERWVLASTLLNACMQRYGMTDYKVLKVASGALLENILLQHPFYERQVPIILGNHVTADAGTGAVHTAPAHGQEDYQVGQKYHLPLVNPVGSDGCFLPNTLLVAGQHVFKANDHIIKLLEERHNLVRQAKFEHSYPHCWRHKTPLIFLATPQWFIAIQQRNLQTAAIAAADRVRWIPDWGLSSISSMIVARPDWCISRQRNWGTPITLLVHKQTRDLYPETISLMQKIADRIEKEGMEAWFNSTPEDWLGEAGKDYDKITDVLDVWFDSGVVHFAVKQQHPELTFPADVYLEGSDQYRGWFQSSLLTAVAMQLPAGAETIRAEAPYKTVLTHGFTVDEKGRKMSKSLGNVIAPEKVINTYGADILRLWAASTDYRAEIACSDEILKRAAEAYRRIRNTARYFLSNLFDFDPAQHMVPATQMLSLDRWAVERAQILQAEIQQDYDNFQFHLICQRIHNFCIVDMGGFYLDIIKDRQYTMQKNSVGRRSAQTAMYHLIAAMVRWLAPILSFTAEEIWQYLPGKNPASVFLTTWYEDLQVVDQNDPIAEFSRQTYWQDLSQVRDGVNKEIEKCRNEGEIGSSLEAEIELYCKNGSTIVRKLKALHDELRFVFIASSAKVTLVEHPPIDAVGFQVNGEEIWVKVTPSRHNKCARCWHRRADLGEDVEHPELCERCLENVEGAGEVRRFA